MVLYTPPIQRLPVITSPPVRDRRVMGVSRVAAQATGERDAHHGRSLRQRLIDMVMDEVEEFPDLTPEQREHIRGNLGRFSDRQPDQNKSQQHAKEQHAKEQPALVPPPIPAPLPEDPVEVALTALEGGRDPAEVMPPESVRLAEQMRRLLEMHSDRAVKIASYIHALQALIPESHSLTMEA
jgi:hypothetical protein